MSERDQSAGQAIINIIVVIFIGIIIFAPFYYLHIIFRKTRKLKRSNSLYELSQIEKNVLRKAESDLPEKKKKHDEFQAAKIKKTLRGDFDQRSKIGKIAHQNKIELDQEKSTVNYLKNLPKDRLREAIDGRKKKIAAFFSLSWVGIAIIAKLDELQILFTDVGITDELKNELVLNYLIASSTSLLVFAVSWVVCTVIYSILYFGFASRLSAI